MSAYCEAIKQMKPETQLLHKNYHDNHYGFPITEDRELFGRLVLEINQAGLSWTTILKKENAFRLAFQNFNIKKVAKYSDIEKAALLNNENIIRNKLKIEAVVHNANVILEIQKTDSSFKCWLDKHHQNINDIEEWTKLFKKTFRFVGKEIVNEFLMSIGYLQGAHHTNCPIYKKIISTNPAWKTK